MRAGDGELVWRFRASPEDRLLVAMQSLESVWPVPGSVLVRDGKVWFTAGRSPYFDGGIYLYALDAVSGKVLVQQTIFSRGPQEFHTSKPAPELELPEPGLPDILSASDGLVYMRWLAFDDNGKAAKVKPHLFSATGFLDDTWWHRTYWQYGTWMQGGFGGWPKAAQQAPAGRLMVTADDLVFSFDRSKYESGNGGNAHAGHVGVVKYDYQDSGLVAPSQNPYLLYAAAIPDAFPAPTSKAAKWRRDEHLKWRTSVPVLVRAMLLADKTLFLAGPNAGVDNAGLAQLQTEQPGKLLAVSSTDGQILAQRSLDTAPVFDGMAAASGRLFLATLDGKILCLGR